MRAPGLLLGDGVRVGEGGSFGAYVVVHEGTIIGEGCSIEDHAVLGKHPRLSRHSTARGEVGALQFGARASVGTGRFVCPGASVGAEAILGDQSFVRERTRIGERSVIGRGTVVDNDVQVGASVRMQTGVYLTRFTIVEDDVLVGPGASTTNDDSIGRHGPETPSVGATLRRARRVGGGAVLTRGCRWGSRRSWPPGRSLRARSLRVRWSWACRRASCASCARRIAGAVALDD